MRNVCIYYIGDDVDISHNVSKMHCDFEYTKTKLVFSFLPQCMHVNRTCLPDPIKYASYVITESIIQAF
jgi:hypothetical protein